jgi:uncharacterized CHY-type Zn-finger protein
MPQKYLHYFGNESNQSLLEAYGIVTKDQQLTDVLRSKQCPNCSEPNKLDSKFCGKCRMVLTYDAYSETVEVKQEKDAKIDKLSNDISVLKAALTEVREWLKNPAKLSEIAG